MGIYEYIGNKKSITIIKKQEKKKYRVPPKIKKIKKTNIRITQEKYNNLKTDKLV